VLSGWIISNSSFTTKSGVCVSVAFLAGISACQWTVPYIRIITSSRTRDSCRELFKKLEILPLYSQYIYSISIFVIKNQHLFYTNIQIHSIDTRFKTNLHPPTANLTKFQKGVYYSTIKIFNNLPHEIKDLVNDILPFQNASKRFLLTNSFYNSKEYFNYRRRSIEI